jgi:hypothetical protein
MALPLRVVLAEGAFSEMPPPDFNPIGPSGNNQPPLGVHGAETTQDTSKTGPVETPGTSEKPNSLDQRSLLVLGTALASKDDLLEGVKPLKLTFFAKVKEFFGFESSTAKALRAADALERTIDHALSRLAQAEGAVHGGYGEGMSRTELQDHLQNIADDAKRLSAALGQWKEKHTAENPSHALQEQRLTVQKGIDAATALMDKLSEGKSDEQVKSLFLGNGLPRGFPLDDLPRLKGLVLSEAVGEAVKGAKTLDSFLRGQEVAAYNTVVGGAVKSHFSSAIETARETSKQHAVEEGAAKPELLGMSTSAQLREPDVLAAVANDYKLFIQAMLGDSVGSAQQAAHNLDPKVVEMTRHVKEGLDQAVAEGSITQQEADKAVRTLVVNNVFLRGINPEFMRAFDGQSDTTAANHLQNRANGIGVLMQKHANGVAFGGSKDPHMAHLNQGLAPELAKVNAFIDEFVKIL